MRENPHVKVNFEKCKHQHPYHIVHNTHNQANAIKITLATKGIIQSVRALLSSDLRCASKGPENIISE